MPASPRCGCWRCSTRNSRRSAASARTWTCGRIALEPGAPSIIPGQAEILFQFRDIDVAVLERLDAVPPRLRAGEQPARALPRRRSNDEQSLPAPCDAAMHGRRSPAAAEASRRAAGSACRAAPGMTRNTWPARCRSAMLFMPSIGGISHHWAEDTKRGGPGDGIPRAARGRATGSDKLNIWRKA